MARAWEKVVTLSARMTEGEVERVERLRGVGFGRGRYSSSGRRPGRSDVIREALRFAEEELANRDTVQGKQLAKLIPKK